MVTATYTVTGTLTAPTVAAGDSHSLAIRDDGTFWAWGANNASQLGDGTTTQRTLPILLSGISGAVALEGGQNHSLGVTASGAVLAWGLNSNGQLGDGTTTLRSLPTTVPSFANVVGVAAGTSHSHALKSDGTVWSWGLNSSGQLGDTTTTQRTSPVQASGLSNITVVSAGGSFSFAVKSDGTAWSWGTNGNGQLGTGNTTSRSTPGQVSGLTTATHVAAGEFFGLAVLSDGTVRGWGHNGNGQLGDSTTTQRTSPVTVGSLSSITQVAAGQSHALALESDGTVWAWGYNGFGQVGDNTTTSRTAPVAVSGLPSIVGIAAGWYHSLAVGADGSVWAWGKNGNGQLGDGTTTSRLVPVQIANADMVWKVPTPVLSVASGTYTAAQTVTVTSGDAGATLHYTVDGSSPTEAHATVASGGTVAVDVSLTLKVRAWKPGAVASEVAVGAYELKVLAPTFSPGTGSYGSSQNVTISSATSGATLTYTTDGTDPTSGSTAYGGAVAISDTRTLKARAFKTGWTPSDSAAASYWIDAGTVATPTIAPAEGTFPRPMLVTLTTATTGATLRYTTDGTTPTLASAAYIHPFLVARTTVVKARAFLVGYAASATATSTFTLDPEGQASTPTILPAGGRFATKQVASVTGPEGATLRYTTNGDDPTDTDTAVPGNGLIAIDVATILKVRAWVAESEPSHVARADFVITGAVAAGYQHSLGLLADGTVYGWGSNDGTGVAKSAPTSMLTDGAAIAGGYQHALAVKADGTVWAWGYNGFGQLGDGTTFTRQAAVQTSTLTDVIAVAGGYQHSLALKSDGTVWAWGDNFSGQIGDGTMTSRLTPVQVPGLRGVTSIAAGDGFSLAVQRDGSGGGFVWAWGKNANGQLGDGTTANRLVPIRVLTLTTAAQVAAAKSFSVARLVDGTVAAWGANESGQVGDLGGADVLLPQAVPTLMEIATIAAGAEHALALDAEGRVWGWGRQEYGRMSMQVSGSEPIVGAPKLLPGFTAAAGIAAGWVHTLVARFDGTVWAAGEGTATGLGGGSHFVAEAVPSFSLVSNAWLMQDQDADGLLAWEEYLASTDPLAFDTNGNGLSDLIDVRRKSQTTNPDDDGDGLPNIVELMLGTDPFLADTDGDSVSDLLDAFPLDPERDEAPEPNPSDTTPPVITLTKPTNAVPVGGGGGF